MGAVLQMARLARAWRLWLAAALLAGLGVSLASAPASPSGTAARAAADMRAGRAFVLVVVDAGDRRLAASEAYGDAHAYLRSFVERSRGEPPVHQLTPAAVRTLLPKWPRSLRNATLFAQPQGRGLLHRGLVLEPAVYAIGKDFIERDTLAAEAGSHGLEPFEWK